MVDYKEINAAKFKENLIGNFGDNDKVQILFDELVENNTEKNPFFYSIILTHIEKNHLSITDLVDSKNQVHFDKINVAIVEAEKQFQENQNVEKEKSERNNQNNEQITPLIFILIRACVHYALFEDEFYMKSQIETLKETLELFIMKYNPNAKSDILTE